MLTEQQRLKRNEYMRNWKKRNKASVNKTNQKWKNANREKVREAGREYMRSLRETDPERIREAVRRSSKRHPDRVKLRRRRWYGQKGREYFQQWGFMDRRRNPERYILQSARVRAKRQNLPFDLELEDIEVPPVCPVLGIKLEIGTKGFHPNSPSADRLKPELGYVKGNVRIVSWRANAIKRDATLDELRRIVAYMERETQ